MGVAALVGAGRIVLRQLLCGQTNFFRMLWKFNQVYNPEKQYADHFREVHYALTRPPSQREIAAPKPAELYVHHPQGGKQRVVRAPRAPGLQN